MAELRNNMEKQFIIKYDVINDQVSYENPDKLSFIEVMGILGITNLMITEEWSKED